MKSTRKSFSTWLLTGKLCSLLALSAAVEAVQPEPFVAPSATESQAAAISDRIIVKYKNSTLQTSAATLSRSSLKRASDMTGTPLRHMRRLATGAQLLRVEEKKSKAELEELVSTLMQDPEVEYAEVDILHKPMAIPSDPRYSEQWHYFESTAGLNLPDAWDITEGEGVVVAVIDTGYRPHADLIGNILPGYDMISETNISQDGDGRDSDASDTGDWAPAGYCRSNDSGSASSWHGTHVAGTIAAVTNNGLGVAGVAYKAKVVPIRALGRCGGRTSDIADAIIWGAGGSVSGVPANPNPAQVLNLSLGGSSSCSKTQQSAIDTARSLGATVVVAAGNEAMNAANSSPANCSGVVTVAAVDRDGGRAWYSNYGSVVDVAAPGGDNSITANGVLSTLNAGTTSPGRDSYAYYQGTSMATPHVAGAAALLYSVSPSLTPDEIESILKNTSRSFPGTCSQCGSGIVDAAAAVQAVVDGDSGDDGDGSNNGGIDESGLSGAQGSWQDYTFEVAEGASSLEVLISGGSGDADLYVRYGSAPTLSRYSCRPWLIGNDEICSFDNPQAGTWHIGIHGYSRYSGVSLQAH